MKEILIGHRGEPDSWPENSLEGFREVLRTGARFIETDIQLTADGIAVLSHDASLLRLTGQDLSVTESRYSDIASLSAGYPERFGDRYRDCRIASLQEFNDLLAGYPAVRAFVEVKHASLQAFGAGPVIDRVVETLADTLQQCILISFDYGALEYARAHTDMPLGWVLPHWEEEIHKQATLLAPEYLFVNRKRVPPVPAPLWQGPWRWVVYTVNEENELAPLIERGFDMIETNVISKLLTDTGHD